MGRTRETESDGMAVMETAKENERGIGNRQSKRDKP